MNKIIETAKNRFENFKIENQEKFRKLSGTFYIAVCGMKPIFELQAHLLGQVGVVDELEIVQMIDKVGNKITNFILAEDENLPKNFLDAIGIESLNYYTVVMGQDIDLNHKFLLEVLLETGELTSEMAVNLQTQFEGHVANMII